MNGMRRLTAWWRRIERRLGRYETWERWFLTWLIASFIAAFAIAFVRMLGTDDNRVEAAVVGFVFMPMLFAIFALSPSDSDDRDRLADQPAGTVIVEDAARGWMYRETRVIRLVGDGRFALRMLAFDSARAIGFRQVPGCSYDYVDHSLYLPVSPASAQALAAFAGEVSVLWTTEAWHKATELGI